MLLQSRATDRLPLTSYTIVLVSNLLSIAPQTLFGPQPQRPPQCLCICHSFASFSFPQLIAGEWHAWLAIERRSSQSNPARSAIQRLLRVIALLSSRRPLTRSAKRIAEEARAADNVARLRSVVLREQFAADKESMQDLSQADDIIAAHNAAASAALTAFLAEAGGAYDTSSASTLPLRAAAPALAGTTAKSSEMTGSVTSAPEADAGGARLRGMAGMTGHCGRFASTDHLRRKMAPIAALGRTPLPVVRDLEGMENGYIPTFFNTCSIGMLTDVLRISGSGDCDEDDVQRRLNALILIAEHFWSVQALSVTCLMSPHASRSLISASPLFSPDSDTWHEVKTVSKTLLYLSNGMLQLLGNYGLSWKSDPGQRWKINVVLMTVLVAQDFKYAVNNNDNSA